MRSKAELLATTAVPTPPPHEQQRADQPKRDRHGFRGTPPPPLFDFDALAPGTQLNDHETAAVLRSSTNTLSTWRQSSSHPLKWITVAGGRVRYRVADIRAFLASSAPRKRKPKPSPAPTATTEILQDAAPPRRHAPRRPRRADAAAPAESAQ
jgi:hypothetical protein